MDRRMPDLPKVQAPVTHEMKRQIKRALADSGMKIGEWLKDAIAAHLQRGGYDPGEQGVLAGLDVEDRERVERFVKFLRKSPPGLKEASDMGQTILNKALKEVLSAVDANRE